MTAPATQTTSAGSRVLLAGVAAVLMTASSSCGTTPTVPASEATSSFTGPWAEEIAYYDSITDSDFAHRAFADSAISDAEVQEGKSLILDCYDNHGATVEYDAFGYAQVEVITGTEDPMQVMSTCEFADGGVVVLDGQIRLNPENLDMFTIQAACLVAAGIAEPGYTAQDLDQDLASGDLPYSPGDAIGAACMKDPLGLATPAGDAS
jgi:hypothetical protein